MVNEVWCEKYRPKTFEEVVGQKEIIEELSEAVKRGNISHLLLHGPPGTGKTTISYVIARYLYGDNFRNNFLELNGSDERGINTIREKVKEFARVSPLGQDFKIIFLDEADYLTPEAQAALRRIMETYSKVTRFVLSCNNLANIIEPIKSRCAKFEFKKLDVQDIVKYLKSIVEKEKCKISDDVLTTIATTSNGDMRSATNLLQSVSLVETPGKNIAKRESNFTEEILICILQGNKVKARTLMADMVKDGWNERQMLQRLRDVVFEKYINKVDCELEKLIMRIVKVDDMLVRGVDSTLALDGLVF